MILQIIGQRASEVYVNHLPRMFCDVAQGMGEDSGVVFDDDKLREVCETLHMKSPGVWGYKKLPNRLYFGAGPHFDPSGLKVMLKEDVLEPPLDELDIGLLNEQRTMAASDASAMDRSIEDGAVLTMRTLFRNKDYWVDIGELGAKPDPSLITLNVHDLDEILGIKGLSIIHSVIFDGVTMHFTEGSGEEIDYEVRCANPGA